MARAQLTTDEEAAMRQRLAEAALDLYRQEGLEAVSLRRIADAVGLSHTLPYRYFPHKEALLVAMRIECTQRFEAYVRRREKTKAALPARVRSIAAAYVEFVREHPRDYQLIFSTDQPAPTQYPDLLAARRRFFDHAVDVVSLCVDAGVLKGDPRAIAHLFWIALHGLMTLHVANQLVHGYTLEELVEPLVNRMLESHS